MNPECKDMTLMDLFGDPTPDAYQQHIPYQPKRQYKTRKIGIKID
jgi:hypothetical protein